MSRLTRSPIPTNNHLLKPNSLKPRLFSAELRKKCNQQKTSYDKNSKPLKQLNPDQVVHIQTPSGFDRLGTIIKLCPEPRSYIVSNGKRNIRRNRHHLLPVPEKPSTITNPRLQPSLLSSAQTIRPILQPSLPATARPSPQPTTKTTRPSLQPSLPTQTTRPSLQPSPSTAQVTKPSLEPSLSPTMYMYQANYPTSCNQKWKTD